MREQLWKYVKSVLSMDDYKRGMEAWEAKEPIPYDITDSICDMCEEFCADNDLPEGWWLSEFEDADEVFKSL